MFKIIGLSRIKEKGVNILSATFQTEDGLTPLRINEVDNYEDYHKALVMLKNNELTSDEGVLKLYGLMSPVERVNEEIKKSKELTDHLVIVDGEIFFGKFKLEETLARHILSLLGDNDTPKDESLWGSYVKFLDNLHQNVDEDVREQLFKWLSYENESLGGFGITEDGCLIGYRGCNGTVLEPVSVHSGPATVDGVDMNGNIPNKVGSVITMPRSGVQVNPAIGCSTGLHVGTKDYATNWAPILLVVKVNPRDVVSVPYECGSQKMRVCEYEILEVLDSGGDQNHQFFRKDTKVKEDDYKSPSNISLSDVDFLLHENVEVIYDEEKDFEGVVVDVYNSVSNPGLVIKSEDGEYKHIKLHRMDYIEVVNEEDPNEDAGEQVGITWGDLLGEQLKVAYDSKEFEGVVVDLFLDRLNPGIVLKSESGEYKHIKINRMENVEILVETLDMEATFDSIKEIVRKETEEAHDETEAMKEARTAEVGDYVFLNYGDENKLFDGIVCDIYKDHEGLIIRKGDVVKHIKLNRINEIVISF